ncbi:hypothetical protein ACFFRR_000138 [Megaselia abdita]
MLRIKGLFRSSFWHNKKSFPKLFFKKSTEQVIETSIITDEQIEEVEELIFSDDLDYVPEEKVKGKKNRKKGNMICLTCGIIYYSDYIRYHIRACHPESYKNEPIQNLYEAVSAEIHRVKTCKVCNKMVLYKSLGNHMVLEHNFVKCIPCGKVISKVNFRTHIKRKHPRYISKQKRELCEPLTTSKLHGCHICTEKFTSSKNLETHKCISFKQTKKRCANNVKCMVCGVIIFEVNFKMHVKRKHPLLQKCSIEELCENLSSTKLFQCDGCQKKFVDVKECSLHKIECFRSFYKAIKNGEYECLICHRSVVSELLATHINILHTSVKCLICSEQFSRQMFRPHIKRDHPEYTDKPTKELFERVTTTQELYSAVLENSNHVFSCGICGKQFGDAELLKSHLLQKNIHLVKIKWREKKVVDSVNCFEDGVIIDND